MTIKLTKETLADGTTWWMVYIDNNPTKCFLTEERARAYLESIREKHTSAAPETTVETFEL